jgi:hypothetical protein
MASTYLTKTLSTPTNGQKWTWSGWVKRSKLNGDQALFNAGGDGSPNATIRFGYSGDNKIYVFYLSGGSMVWQFATNAQFRDTSGWYHIVISYDSTQLTATDRLKLYVNNSQQTFSNSTNSPQNITTTMNSAVVHYIGNNNGSNYFDGSMSHIHFIDGTAYDATAFGEYDANGVWTINTSPSVTYGTNGFFILKDGNSVTDQSPNTNNFTVSGGTLTNTEDNPSNVFATLSPHILPRNSGGTISNGNLFFGTSAAQWTTESSAFGIANGKYYFEVKLKDNGSDRRFRWGLQKNAEITKTGNNKVIGGADNNAIGYKTQGESATQGGYFINQTETNLTDGDINEDNAIYGFAIDLDNQRMYGHFNGTWLHSGNPSAGTGGIDVSSFYTVGEPLFPSFTTHNSNIEINFGNGYFGTTAVSSAGTNASGIGIFEYDVPTGYTALCTKGLNL